MSYSSPSGNKKTDPAAKQLEQQIKLLEAILKKPGNDNCADCGQKGPRWASINLGIFVCIRCSGIHRNMGTHISKVKSVSLDKWTPEMIRTVDVIGNLNAKRIYEGKCSPNYPRPRESDTYGVEQWIRDKYDRKRFYDAAAAAEILAGVSAAANSPQPKQSAAVDEEQARKLRREQRRKQRELEAEKARNVSPQPVQQYSQPAPPVAAPSVDLLLGGPVSTQQPPQQQFIPQQQFTSSSADAFFSEFQTSSTPTSFPNSQAAAFFQEAPKQPEPVSQPVSQPEPPKASKEQILSLFKADQNPSNNTGGLFSLNGFGGVAPTQQVTPQAPNYAALNSMGMNNMGVYGMNTMGMNNMGAYGMNTMGMNTMGMNAYGVNNTMGMNAYGVNNTMGMNAYGVNNTMGMNAMGMNNVQYNPYNNTGINLSAAVRPNPAATPAGNTWGATNTNAGMGMGFGTTTTPATNNFNW